MEQRISKLSLDKGNKFKEGQGNLPKERVLWVCGKEIKRRKKCEEEFLVFMCGEVFMGKVCARIKHGRKLCVTSTCSKASGFLVQLVVPPKSTVGFMSSCSLEGVRGSPKISASSGLLSGSYTSWK